MDDNVYEIRITLPQGTEKESAVAKSAANTSTGQDNNEPSTTAKDMIGMAKTVVAYTGAKRIAESYISHNINTVSLRTGATEYEQKLQFAYSEGSQAVGSVAAIAMGAAVGGLPGAAIAAVGVGLNYIMKAIGWAQNAEKIQMQKDLEDVSLQMQRARMGISGSRGSNQ